jgi:hypothetical protein
MASHQSNTKRQRTAASRFCIEPALDAETVTSLAAAALPGYTTSTQNLAVISVMLQQTASAARRKLEAAKLPSRDTVMAFWMLEGMLTGDERFVDSRSDEFIAGSSIVLEDIDLNYIQENVSQAWKRESFLYYALMNVLLFAAVGQHHETFEDVESELHTASRSFPKTWAGVYDLKEMLLGKIDTNSDTDDESSEIQESDSE